MATRYRETVEVLALRDEPRADEGVVPARFRWRGAVHTVVGVLGHWREDAGWWVGRGVEVPQRDLWRVEVVGLGGSRARGICELVREGRCWRLDRVWD